MYASVMDVAIAMQSLNVLFLTNNYMIFTVMINSLMGVWIRWTGTVEWNGGMDWTGLDWNGMAGCNFVIKFCGRDQTLTRVHRPWPCPLATMHQCNVTLCV